MSGISHRLKRANVPKGKDIGEFWQMGGNLRSWVQELTDEEIRITNNLQPRSIDIEMSSAIAAGDLYFSRF